MFLLPLHELDVMAWGRKALSVILPILPSFTTFTAAQSCSQTTKLIVDTDLFSDVDDAAALLLASTLPCTDLLAVQVNYPSSYSVLAASSILTYYGHADVPIGSSGPLNNDSFFDDFYYEFSDYASKVQYHWNHSLADAEDAWDSVTLYRKILSEQDDGSVTIASIGFFDNLSGLLNSTADSYSSLDGYDLVAAKVKKLAIMGGAYPSGWEYNFGGSSPLLTAHVVNTWPGSMTFSGSYLGGNVTSGGRLTVQAPSSDPVSAAYKWYIGYNTPRYSWDPITVMYAVQGLGDLLEYGNVNGYNNVSSDGTNAWMNDTSVTNQHWIVLKEGVSNTTLGDRLDDLYVSGAYHAWMSKSLL